MKSVTRTLLQIFLLIFFTANGYILLSGSVCFWLSNQDDLSPQQTRLFDTCATTWTQGTTKIFTLLDSNALKLLQAEKDDKK